MNYKKFLLKFGNYSDKEKMYYREYASINFKTMSMEEIARKTGIPRGSLSGYMSTHKCDKNEVVRHFMLAEKYERLDGGAPRMRFNNALCSKYLKIPLR